MRLFVVAGVLIVLILPLRPASAAVREDWRACQAGIVSTIPRGGPPPQATAADDQYCLGLAYWFQPSPLPHDEAASAAWHRRAAEQGQGAAMVALGYDFEQGHGVEKNVALAMHWYRRGATLGNADAMFNIGRLYETGKGVQADDGEALKWFTQAAREGSVDAQVALSQRGQQVLEDPGRELVTQAYDAYLKKDYARAADLYRQAAQQGNARAQVNLGELYRTGKGVPRDDDQSAHYFRMAAEKGYPLAQARLGLAYENGNGVPEDWGLMQSWCAKAAAQHDALGLTCIGRLYQFGMGVPQDRDVAIDWFNQAWDQGDAGAGYFAIYLKTAQNCVGYRNDKEREKYFGLCEEPKGEVFRNSAERNHWLGVEYSKWEAQQVRMFGLGTGGGGDACSVSGGWSNGGGCYNNGGYRYDPNGPEGCRGSDWGPC